MPQQHLHGFGRHPLLQQEGGKRVAAIMQADVREPCLLEHPAEVPIEVPRIDGFPIRLAEDQPLILVRRTQQQLVGSVSKLLLLILYL